MSQFTHGDPCGSVPAWAYNSALENRNDILIYYKEDLEALK
jgi:hypothetical protein